ncbi:MAG: SDR family oxidoreductase [Alphaproteobacteria bacterium]|nr:SDR family oxidoreductase [Alphaproteobacteria bacterium]
MSDSQQSYRDRTVLITGGTKGIGLATAVSFAEEGAQLVLTYRWGSADEADVINTICSTGAPAPLLIEADVARTEDTERLFGSLKDRGIQIHAFVCNASNAVTVQSISDYTERGFMKSVRASSWPLADYLFAAKRTLGAYPRYVIAMSSDGPDRFTPAYDFVAASKAAAEALVRYLACRLRGEGVRINVVRSRAVKTDAFTDTFGSEFYGFLRQFVPEDRFVTPRHVADATFALCSGLFDAMTGQVLMVDRGNSFADGISTLYEQRAELGL